MADKVNTPDPSRTGEPKKQHRMWVLDCPFNKRGVPVMGTFGSRSDTVIVFTAAAWKQLCADVPQLQTTMFEVGSYD